ncbi:DNA/RNA helicase domain-containing protein [Streptomyces purpurogeneiscleroticus]|uniref:DNA/RNA helicase domain-containing protein n=1 Tax=Streptomyces purpurogeneiscleroticus TaxID=68259 RepID=UPI001CBE2F0F|nr:DNA/RNA helicase domain-containing protein [Streptomyces purpurogeneiscleroticus]
MEAFWPAEELVRDRERLIPKIVACYEAAHPKGEKPSDNDTKSWRESLYEVATALVDLGLGQVYVFVEYRVHPSMNPIDAVLAGSHPDGGLSFAAIELKQWSEAERPDPSKATDGLCAQCRKATTPSLCANCAVERVFAPCFGRHKKHPAVQVKDNLDSLRRHHSMFDDRYVHLVGAAYLHNLKDPQSQWISRIRPAAGIPTFTARQPADLRKFLKSHFSPTTDAEAAQELLNGRRSTSLLTSEVGAIVNGYTKFSLLEKQREAVDGVMAQIRKPSTGAKKVYVVSGRAGTGKSLVALTLLGEALNEGADARFVSGGVASRENFKRGVRGKGKAFTTLNQVADKVGADQLDLLLCDEAHRLTERPMTGSFSMRRDGESSVSVIVTRAKVPVFFIDGDQRLFAEEIWSESSLIDAIQELRAEVVPVRLDRALRAVGSSTYDTWVQRLFHSDPLQWSHDAGEDAEPFELYYTDSAARMERFLQSKLDAGLSTRISAGLCWRWTDDTGTAPDVAPEEGWSRPWNAGDNHQTPGVPKRRFWATEPGGFGQIGCVHTAQGLEYEWGGVIMGPDLTWSEGSWTVDRQHVRSKASRIASDEELGERIRNAYGVLMTRSIRGTVLYSVDPDTRQLFADLGIPKI